MRSKLQVLIGALAAAGAMSALGATNTFTTPPFRGQPGAAFDGWESFSIAVGNPGNQGDLPTSSKDATLFQAAPGALVLGSGNLYNGADKSRFEIRYSGDAPVGTVVFQARSLGTEFNYDSVRLVAWADSLPAARTELERTAFGGPPGTPGSGFSVTSKWEWDISGSNADTFAIAFQAADLNLSLDSVTLDVQAVPEPGAMALGALGAALLFAVRRRQARAVR